MARKQKLKVYRTPIGFHDAYVAAPSQKAALTAWGSDVDLFARGVAETVDDEALTRDALAEPGKVIRRSRGTANEHLAALPPDKPRQASRPPAPPSKDEDDAPATAAAPRQREIANTPKPRKPTRAADGGRTHSTKPKSAAAPKRARITAPPKPKPRPSRRLLDTAERALEKLIAKHRVEAAALRAAEQAAAKQRRDGNRRHERERVEAERRVSAARSAYSKALAGS